MHMHKHTLTLTYTVAPGMPEGSELLVTGSADLSLRVWAVERGGRGEKPWTHLATLEVCVYVCVCVCVCVCACVQAYVRVCVFMCKFGCGKRVSKKQPLAFLVVCVSRSSVFPTICCEFTVNIIVDMAADR